MKIALLATGGTVAMTSDAGAGARPTVSGQALAAGGGWGDGVAVEARQVLQKPSASLTLADVAALAEAIEAAVAEGFAGVVVTHGTDTIEETAFALGLMLDVDAPVVLTGAMRTPDQPGADGPANIAAAVRVAASDKARGLGPLVVFGDEIHAGALVRKNHTQRPAAFSSFPFGPIGLVAEGQVRIRLTPPAPLARKLRPTGPLPVVPILHAGMDLEPETIEAFIGAPIGGLVLAAAGGGHVSARSTDALQALAKQVPVILASRTGAGRVLTQSYGYEGGEMDLIGRGLIPAGTLRAVQARILLQLVLSAHLDVADTFGRL
jgi:L-asparaginase